MFSSGSFKVKEEETEITFWPISIYNSSDVF